ncbi:MAG: hypothetical protein AB7I38_03965 [Dehalococcoidia bacterium]
MNPSGPRRGEQVRRELADRDVTLPEQICRSLTCNQSKAMARHTRFTVETGL